jgi:beta-lactamase regulating signal transducer with metallopeptidase domain
VNALLLLAVQNTLVALVLAFLVYALTRVWRIPPLAHLLWLLVLLKLVAPPVMRVDWFRLLPPRTTHADHQQIADTPRNGAQAAATETGSLSAEPAPIARSPETSGGLVNVSSDRAAHNPPATAVGAKPVSRVAWIWDWEVWDRALILMFCGWVSGAVFFSLVAGTRILRFERSLKDTLPAPERLQRLAREIAGKLNVRRIPDVRFVESVEVPMLWWAGRRATIVLPTKLFRQLDDSEAALILAHELAHLRRRDHWVRAIEMLVSIVYWWNPLVWAIRGQIHRAEDLCCDAWVRWAFPDCTKRYAEVLLKTAELLNVSRVGSRLVPASPFLNSHSLKARIEMLLQNRFMPRLSKKSIFVVALLALVTLPSFFSTSRTDAETPSTADAPAAQAPKPDRPPGSEFPYTVRFEQGASKLPDGDKIAITEVRGTASSFTPGNIYWIKGTYTLASRDKAVLLAATTAADSKFGTGSTFKVQQTIVDRGTGTFALFLPMSCQGWPHVSFYPTEGGGDIGGTYFGTGDFVLKKWWEPNVLGGPRTIEPDFNRKTKKSLRDKGVRVAVVCRAPALVRLNFIDVDKDIAKYCAHQLNQRHIPTINPDRIQEWLDKHENWDKSEEIGQAAQATHVILLDVHKYNLFEENTHELYKGRAEVLVSVFEMQKDGTTEKVYTKEITCQYPLETPRETSEISYDRFRREYLARLSEEIGCLFYSHANGDDMRDAI